MEVNMFPGSKISETASRYPEKIAIIYKNQRITFCELERNSCTLAAYLKEEGVRKGDKVAIFLPNCPEFAISYLALAKLGAVGVLIDARSKAKELKEIAKDAGFKLIVCHETNKKHTTDIEGVTKILSADSLGKILMEERAFASHPILGEDDDALILYTSGSTGRPKGVILTFGNLGQSPSVMGKLWSLYLDVTGVALPMSHIAGFIYLTEIIDRGSTMVIFDQLSPQTILESIERYKITGFWSAPPIFQLILEYPHRKRYDTANLKFVAMMGMTVPLTLMQDFRKEFPHLEVLTGLGLTETSPFILACRCGHPETKLGSMGKPVPGVEVRIVDDNGTEVPQGSVGELITRGPHVMKGYYNQPEETAKRIRDGWFYTGDMGYFDEDGYFWHLGRKDDLVIIGGLNVYPAEVENVLKQLPQISEAAVYGVSDGMRGKILKASVVLKPGEYISLTEVTRFCRENLANFKVPKQVEILDHLPKSPVGKIDKRLLARE